MKKSILASSILLAISSSALAAGGPLYKNNCQLTLNHPLLSTGIYFDESCQTAYVAPPVIGDFEVNHLHKESTTYLFCPDYDVSKKAATAKKELLDSYIEQVKEYNQLIKESKLGEYKTEEANINTKINELSTKLNKLKAEKSEITIRFNREYTKYEDCLADITIKDKEKCNPQLDRASTIQKELFSIKKDVSAVDEELYNAQIALLDIQGKIRLEVIRNNDLKEMQEKTADLVKSIEKIRFESLNTFQKYASLIGGSASLSYFLNWQQLINDYAEQNPNANLTWLPLPINNATFHINLRADTIGENRFPVILATNFPGIKNQISAINPPEGNTVSTLTTVLSTREPAEIGFSHSMRGTLDLSVNAMCTLINEDNSDYNKIFDTYVSPKVNYNFQLKVHRKYTAKYNLEQIYKRIEELKDKHGFLSSKSKHEIFEDRNSKELFDIKFDADDSRFTWTPEEQEQLTKDIRNTLLKRVLEQISLFNNIGTNIPEAKLPETGVGKLAKLLQNADCSSPNIIEEVANTVSSGNSDSTANASENNSDNLNESENSTLRAFNDACKFTYDKKLVDKLSKSESMLVNVAASFASGNYLAVAGSILSSFGSSSTKVTFIQNNSHTAEEKVDQVSFVDKTTTVTFRPKAQ
ncbi:hypothetical protein [Zooshikella harenae]|uniref:Uncharacterized protein n=1 Tax=Zooshikella harenae TaxID=2827238 RepID=A0ABS5ZFM8_9GAMM|nr:hypothetical protein [Zooshikella harenae]MBU2712867.1 hypothetical protein [Zooshikella harenae]